MLTNLRYVCWIAVLALIAGALVKIYLETIPRPFDELPPEPPAPQGPMEVAHTPCARSLSQAFR